MNRPMHVELFANGMVMVFDMYGEQIPELQGRYEAVKDKIRENYDGPWTFGVFQSWSVGALTFEQIEHTVKQLKASW